MTIIALYYRSHNIVGVFDLGHLRVLVGWCIKSVIKVDATFWNYARVQ